MMAIELVEPGTTTPNAAATAQGQRRMPRGGRVDLTCGTFGNVFRFLPPLVMPDHLVDEAMAVLEKALVRRLLSRQRPPPRAARNS